MACLLDELDFTEAVKLSDIVTWWPGVSGRYKSLKQKQLKENDVLCPVVKPSIAAEMLC